MSPSVVVNIINMAVSELSGIVPAVEAATRSSPGTQAQISNIIADVQQGLAALQGSENDAAVAKPLVDRILDDLQAVTTALAVVPLPPPGPQILLGVSMLIPTIRGLVGLVWPAKTVSLTA